MNSSTTKNDTVHVLNGVATENEKTEDEPPSKYQRPQRWKVCKMR